MPGPPSTLPALRPHCPAGVTMAGDLIASGQAAEKFREFVDLTRMMGEL